MAAQVVKMRFLVRSHTAAEWTALNEVLLASTEGTGAREMGVEEDTGRYKLGDGVTPWNLLDYSNGLSIRSAADVPYSNTVSGLAATQVQAAIDEIAPAVGADIDPMTLYAAATNGCWFDMTDLTTMFKDTAGTLPVTAVGDAVALIRDKSGFGFDASQATSGKRAVIAQDAFGVYCLRFASGKYYNLGKATNSEILMAAHCVKPTGAAAITRILDNRGTGAGGAVRGMYMRGPSTTSNDDFGIDDGSGHIINPVLNRAAGYKSIACFSFDGEETVAIKFDGVNTGRYRSAGMGSIVNTNNNTLGIAIDGVSQPFVGDMYQVMAVGGRLVTDNELARLQNYLSQKCKF